MDFDLQTEHYENLCKPIKFLEEYWDEVAKVYIKQDYPLFQAGLYSDDITEHMIWQNRRKIKNGASTVLDAGCGIGTNLNYLASINSNVQFAGLNISRYQIQYHEEVAKKDNINLKHGSYDDMPYRSNLFDLVYFDQSIGYRPLLKTYLEASRVLNKGGKLFISDMCQIDDLDPEYSRQIRSLQKNWHYMCFPVWYHLECAKRAGLELESKIDNTNLFLDFSKWGKLVDDELHEFHGFCPYAPIKVSEFNFIKK